ncbi:MAG: hypothetical protein K9H49_18850 [Bacteroidales bacterium]|nr:hypothetical protein [Bacteroidales bacterium]MCF8392097.1 hypothetical protein [Bacteroidales bacterium]
MKKSILLTAIILFSFGANLSAQHFIGIDKEKTKLLAKEAGFYPDDVTKNQKFNYLKFVNSAGTKTFIVFFSEEDISVHTRTVCDYSEYDFVVKDLDKEYKKKDKFLWEYKLGNETYNVTLEEEEWYFIVRVKKK